MKPTKHKASEKERALGAVYKRLEAGDKKKDEAASKEAAEIRTQQECILSGVVYLRHRLKDNCLSFLSDTLYHKEKGRARLAFGRTGVQETVPRFDSTRELKLDSIKSNTCSIPFDKSVL